MDSGGAPARASRFRRAHRARHCAGRQARTAGRSSRSARCTRSGAPSTTRATTSGAKERSRRSTSASTSPCATGRRSTRSLPASSAGARPTSPSGAPSGRAFGYWHIRPVVRTGQHVRLHQLLGHVLPGWGHVHFAESIDGEYRNPLRRGALTPFRDRTKPTVASITMLVNDGSAVDTNRVTGVVDVESRDLRHAARRAAAALAGRAPDARDRVVAARARRRCRHGLDASQSTSTSRSCPPACTAGCTRRGRIRTRRIVPGTTSSGSRTHSTRRRCRTAATRSTCSRRTRAGTSAPSSLAFTIANASPSPGVVLAPGMQSRARRPV